MKEQSGIRDVFITSPIDSGIEKELLRRKVEPRKVPELAINFEIGLRNELQFQAHNKTLTPASVNAIQYPPSNRSSNWSLSNSFHKQDNCTHLSIIQFVDEIGFLITGKNASQKVKLKKFCGFLHQFAKACRQQKNQKPVNTLDEEPHLEDSLKFLQSSSKLYESNYSRGDDNIVATIHNELKK